MEEKKRPPCTDRSGILSVCFRFTVAMNAITEIAVSPPVYTAEPYPNRPKRDCPKNKPLEVLRNEETAV